MKSCFSVWLFKYYLIALNCSQSSGNGKHLKLPQHPEKVGQLAPAQNSSCDYGK